MDFIVTVGKVEHLWIGGIIRLEWVSFMFNRKLQIWLACDKNESCLIKTNYFDSFAIEDFNGERFYLVNMNASFCFESNGDCYKMITVYKETLLPKRICPWDQDQGLSFFTYFKTLFGWKLNLHTRINMCTVISSEIERIKLHIWSVVFWYWSFNIIL